MPGVVDPKCGYTLFISAHCRRKLRARGSSSTWCPCLTLSCTVKHCHKLSCCRDDMTDLAAAAWYCWAGGCRNLMTVPTMSRVTRRIRSMAEAMGSES